MTDQAPQMPDPNGQQPEGPRPQMPSAPTPLEIAMQAAQVEQLAALPLSALQNELTRRFGGWALVTVTIVPTPDRQGLTVLDPFSYATRLPLSCLIGSTRCLLMELERVAVEGMAKGRGVPPTLQGAATITLRPGG